MEIPHCEEWHTRAPLRISIIIVIVLILLQLVSVMQGNEELVGELIREL
jgi:hypothetical protein